MRTIKKEQYSALEEAHGEVYRAKVAIHQMVESINQQIESILENYTDDEGRTLNEALQNFKEKRDELSELVQEVVAQQEDYISERSEDWHDSESGESYQEWATEWEEFGDDLSTAEVEISVYDNISEEVDFGLDMEEPEEDEIPTKSPQ